MKQIILGLSLLLSTSAFAATNKYDLAMELSFNGKKVASPRVIVKEGEKGSISTKDKNEESFIDVIATEAKEKGIMMKFKIGYIGENGQRRIVGEPTIIAREGEPAMIEISQKANAPADLSLSVTAQKVAL